MARAASKRRARLQIVSGDYYPSCAAADFAAVGSSSRGVQEGGEEGPLARAKPVAASRLDASRKQTPADLLLVLPWAIQYLVLHEVLTVL